MAVCHLALTTVKIVENDVRQLSHEFLMRCVPPSFTFLIHTF